VVLPAATSAVFYQGSGAIPITGITPLPEGCAGVAVVEADPGGVLAMVMDQDRPELAHTAAAYDAVPEQSGSRRVALPLVRNHHTAADLVTGIQVMNLDPLAAATVRLEVVDSAGVPVPAGADFTQVVQPLQSGTFYLPSLSTLRARRDLYGSAIVSADRPLAVVAEEVSLNRRSDAVAFTGLPAEVPAMPQPAQMLVSALSGWWSGATPRAPGDAR